MHSSRPLAACVLWDPFLDQNSADVLVLSLNRAMWPSVEQWQQRRPVFCLVEAFATKAKLEHSEVRCDRRLDFSARPGRPSICHLLAPDHFVFERSCPGMTARRFTKSRNRLKDSAGVSGSSQSLSVHAFYSDIVYPETPWAQQQQLQP